MQKNAADHLLAQFIERCKQNKLKITRQRLAIYEELIKSRNHPSADTMFQTLMGKFPNISFDTINRTLLTFYEIGVVDIVEGMGDSRRFDPNLKSHHHIHCIRCGVIVDFFSEDLDNLKIPEQVQSRFTILSKRVVLNGICNKCKN